RRSYHWREETAFDRDGDTDIGCAMPQDAALGPGDIGGGNALQCQSHGLDDEVIDRKLPQGLLVGAAWGALIEPCADIEKLTKIASERQIEMRHRLLRLDEPFGDDAAHAAQGLDVIASSPIEAGDRIVRRR